MTSIAASSPRLPPRFGSRNPLVWLMMLAYRFTIGRIASPVRVIFARAPRLVIGHLLLMGTAEYGLSLDKRLAHLVRAFGSRVNGCVFCDDLETHMALKAGTLTREDVDALPQYTSSPRFDAADRAVLRFVEEVNTARTASDATFAALREHFSEKQIVEITWLNAVGNYLNLQARPLGLGAEGYCERR